MQGTVRALFVAPKKKAGMIPLTQVEAAQTGFAGDFHSAGPPSRQILMISNSVLEEFELLPGSLSENMVIDGFDVMRFNDGQRLQIGQQRARHAASRSRAATPSPCGARHVGRPSRSA